MEHDSEDYTALTPDERALNQIVENECGVLVEGIYPFTQDGIVAYEIQFRFHVEDSLRAVQLFPKSKEDEPDSKEDEAIFIIECLNGVIKHIHNSMN